MNPRISVILPFCNAQSTIREAADSILSQEFSNLELIAVADHCTDASVQMLSGISDRRLQIIENRLAPGVVGAMNTGVRVANSEWIARMDADDYSLPQRLSRQWELAEKFDIVSSCVELTHSLGDGMLRYVEWTNSLLTPDQISRARFIESPIINPTLLMRRSLFDEFGGYMDLEWAEDHDLWLRLLQAGYQITKVDEILVQWRDSETRLTRTDERYGDALRMKMKAHYLAAMKNIQANGVVIAGAGPIGKSLAQDLIELGVQIHGFFEVHPRRIGEKIHGIEVAKADDIHTRWHDAILLGAVGIEGGREKLKQYAEQAGRVEGEDFWQVC